LQIALTVPNHRRRDRGSKPSPSVITHAKVDANTLGFDILPALKREDSHGTAPLGWDIVVYDVTCS